MITSKSHSFCFPQPGWDAYDFAEEVVFDMDTGDFTKKAIEYMLTSIGILQRPNTTNREERVEEFLDEVATNVARLPAGYQIQDQVVSKVAWDDIRRGDSGVVIGRCMTDCADAAQKLLVDFGEKGQDNFLVNDLELVRLVAGYRIGDAVSSNITHNPKRLVPGDMGVVASKSTSTSNTSGERVLVTILLLL